jgi:hypothetical protein
MPPNEHGHIYDQLVAHCSDAVVYIAVDGKVRFRCVHACSNRECQHVDDNEPRTPETKDREG